MPLTKPERDAQGQAHDNGQGDVLSVPFYNGEQDRDEGELTPDRKVDIARDKKCRRANGGYTDRRAVEEDREEIRSCPKARVVEQPEKEEQCAEENGQAYSPRRLPGRLGAPGQMTTAAPAGPAMSVPRWAFCRSYNKTSGLSRAGGHGSRHRRVHLYGLVVRNRFLVS